MTASTHVVDIHAAKARAVFSAAVLSVLLAANAPAGADLVVFTDGHFLRVEGYEVAGERVRLALDNGGLLTVSIRRIDRVIEDEVEDQRPAPEPAPFGLRFADDQAVPDVPYGDLIHASARRHGLNPALVAAVARAESAFRTNAVSAKGARGLMQLMPATAERFGVGRHRVHDPQSNIEAGTRYLRILADRYQDDVSLVLAAYNAGEGTVARYGGVPPYRETRNYLQRIFGFLGLESAAPAGAERVAPASR